MPVNRGDPLSISAGDWNDVVRLLEQWRANGRQLGGIGITQPLPFGWVWLKNTTGTDRAFGDVLGIDDWLTDVATSAAVKYDAIRLKGNTPATATHCGNYAVLQEPIKAGGFGRASMSGIVYAKLDITHASDKYCEIADAVATSLKTNPLGSSRIIAKSTGTGSSSKWGQIRLGEPSTEIVGKTDASIQNAASGTVSVWSGTAGSESDSGANLSTCYNRGRYIYSGEWVRVLRVEGSNYVTPASGAQLLRGQTDAAISKGSSGTVSVYTDGGSDTTDNITATNLVASITASGKNVFCQWCNGTYFITQCECPL